LRGNGIPLAARIVAIAHTYDGLRSARAYRPVMSHADTVEYMNELFGHQRDPALLVAFERCAARFATIFPDCSNER
jgi:HD-GYP domain-containing protein (c-di-GMP phosphodiesterase class II)